MYLHVATADRFIAMLIYTWQYPLVLCKGEGRGKINTNVLVKWTQEHTGSVRILASYAYHPEKQERDSW